MNQETDPNPDLIYSYSRAQAIDDGVLVDVSTTARQAGFAVPVALTTAAWADCVAWADADSRRQTPQDESGRLWDIAALWARWASKPMAMPSLAPTVGTASDLRMAQRTLRRMRDGRLLLQAQGPDGSVVYAIAEAGARVLQSAEVPASSGKDGVRNFSSGYFRHRCIANELAIAGIVQGFRVSTEREIARGLWAGGEVGIAGKKPDTLWRNGNRWHWFEVERSRRNAKDYAQLLAWLANLRGCLRPGLGADLSSGVVVGRVVFVCTAQFKNKLLRDLAVHGWLADEVQNLVVFETLLYKFEGINFY